VGFEHDAGLAGDEGRQRGGLGRVVVLDLAVVEIHARLHHHGDHAAPGAVQFCSMKALRCTSSVRAAAAAR
jgi:hypothetical protein